MCPDYDKDLERVIRQGTPGPAETEHFGMEDAARLGRALEAPLPYSYYFDGVELSDPRVRVLCVDDSLEEQIHAYAREQACEQTPAPLPTLHKATHDETTLAPDLREFIYDKRPSDKAIYDYFCAM